MRPPFALAVLLASSIAGVGAILTVLIEWSRQAATVDASASALWAARAYVAHFDLWTLSALLPSLMICRWLQARLQAVREPVHVD